MCYEKATMSCGSLYLGRVSGCVAVVVAGCQTWNNHDASHYNYTSISAALPFFIYQEVKPSVLARRHHDEGFSPDLDLKCLVIDSEVREG